MTKNERVEWHCRYCGKSLTTYVPLVGVPQHRCQKKAERITPLTKKETK